MTVKDLYNLCKDQIKDGNGDCEVIIGTGELGVFSELEYGFGSPTYDDRAQMFLEEIGKNEDEYDNIVVLN